MDKLIDMAREPKSDDEKMDCCIDSDEKYPWGLRLHLREDEIEKLGISQMPDAGEQMMLVAMVNVAEVGQRETMKDDKNGVERNMELQITQMAFKEPEQRKLTDEEIGQRLYTSGAQS